MPTEVAAALRVHLDTYTQPADDGYVFTADNGGWVVPSNFRKRVWLPATIKVGCPGVRFHDLRHAAATLAAMTGASTKDLMARMGHASQAAAIRYQHATQAQQEVIALRLDELLGSDNVVPLRKAQ